MNKHRRRQMNFGKRDTVRATARRNYHDTRGHAPPKSGMNHNGTTWLGFSRRSKRKPWPIEASWRDWLRETGRQS